MWMLHHLADRMLIYYSRAMMLLLLLLLLLLLPLTMTMMHAPSSLLDALDAVAASSRHCQQDGWCCWIWMMTVRHRSSWMLYHDYYYQDINDLLVTMVLLSASFIVGSI
jgi:hypothetical protein